MHLRIDALVILEVKIAKSFIDSKLSIVSTIANSKTICNSFMIITKSFHTTFSDAAFDEIIIDIDFIVFDTSKVQQ